jgi:dihydroneopterin aldolase
VQEVSGGRQFQLLEAMAAAVADALVARFPLEGARVRVRKPEVRLEAPVAWTAATVERRRP